MKQLKHIIEQPFIFATGMAALIHSTWALGTLFSGHAPEVNWQSWEWYEWIVPALLIAFALDVGQISTSGQIRDNGLTKARAFTFVIFAIATYYLQWLYMAVHMPLLEISPGVTGVHTAIAESLRNVAIWLIPALLPISTVSYTFSGESSNQETVVMDYEKEKREYIEGDYVDHEININLLEDTRDALPFVDVDYQENHSANCEFCEWYKDGYDSQLNASRAIKMHYKSCGVYQMALDEINDEPEIREMFS